MSEHVFERDKISKVYLQMAIPLVFSMVITLIYNLADTFFVAQTQDTDLIAGVSLGVPLFTFLMAIGNIFGQGGSSLISRLLGSKDTENIARVSAFCFYMALFSGGVIGVVLFVLQKPVVYLLGADVSTYFHAASYYRVLALGAPLVVASFIHSNLLRAEGMSKESMIGTVGGAVINIILDPILIKGFGLGAAGAAIASVIGYGCSVVFFMWVVHKKSAVFSLSIKKMRISAAHLGQIFGVGIPAALSNVMQSLAVILLNQFLLPYGNDKIAAMGIVLKVNMIALLALTGLIFGGQPLYGYFYGAKNKAKLKELFSFCIRFIGSIALVLSVLLFVLAPVLIRIFVKDESFVKEASFMLRLQAPTICLIAFTLLMTIVCQSIGEMKGAFVLSISRQGVVFFLALFVGNLLWGYIGILLAQAIADLLSAGIAVFILIWLKDRLFGSND